MSRRTALLSVPCLTASSSDILVLARSCSLQAREMLKTSMLLSFLITVRKVKKELSTGNVGTKVGRSGQISRDVLEAG